MSQLFTKYHWENKMKVDGMGGATVCMGRARNTRRTENGKNEDVSVDENIETCQGTEWEIGLKWLTIGTNSTAIISVVYTLKTIQTKGEQRSWGTVHVNTAVDIFGLMKQNFVYDFLKKKYYKQKLLSDGCLLGCWRFSGACCLHHQGDQHPEKFKPPD
jgi:hypothetical protein